MDIKIASWNIDWIRAENGATVETKKKIVEGNKNKLNIAKHLAEDEKHKYDVFALLEADSDKNAQLEIEGYQKFYGWRNFKNADYNWNGILVYVKECYRPRVDEEVLKEFENNNSACFLPLVITINYEIFHCLFVWALQSQEEWKKGGKAPYGYNRFNEVMKSKPHSFAETRKFINGEEFNVIVIGDYNIYYQENDLNKERVGRWEATLQMMNNYSLIRKENNKNTFGNGSNDHCFVSENLSDLTTLDVGEKSYDGVVSDHRLICLTINDTP